MKNRNILKIIISLFIVFITSFNVKSEEFSFEGNEILILDNGNRLQSKDGIKIISSDNLIITGQNFEYDKLKNHLILENTVNINDQNNQTVIEANKIFYNRSEELLISYGLTKITIENSYIIESEDIFFNRKTNKISAKNKTIIIDKYQNKFISESIEFNVNTKILKGANVELADIDGNKSYFHSFFGDLENKKFLGKDIRVNFNKNLFGNSSNDPRLYGNILESDENRTKLSKGIFTTCKKRDDCPPWSMKAAEVIHDKNKKTINYKNAWLEVYDKPILYFPKFFHPDPTVKRQSGFLVPQFSDGASLGSSFQIPYFKVIAENKDLTFTPRIFANNNLLLQNEYREVKKNSEHKFDIGFFTSALSSSDQESKSHFFSNSKFNFNEKFFSESDLEINLETVTNDTYLKKYQPNSPLITSDNTLNSFINFNGYSENSSFNLEFETYEDLSINTNDRFQYVYPNISISRNLNEIYNLDGDLIFSSNLYQKQFETNKYEQSILNELSYLSNDKFFNNGVLSNFALNIKNPNLRNKTGSNNESKSKSQLLSIITYNLSYPLQKQNELFSNTFKPKLSLRYSPNITKNISDSDQRLDVSNINALNRIYSYDGIEGGQSATYGFEFSKNDKLGNEKINLELFQVIRDKENQDLPKKTTLNKKYSDIIGRLKINTSDNLNLQYNFMVDNKLKDTNLNSILAEIKVNNFVSSFEFLEERNLIGTKSYFGNKTSYKFDENNSIKFSTRKNKEIDLTEFYNLVYQYENDCLKAALEYNKQFYTDGDLKPEEELFFSITIIPFSKLSSTNLN